MCESMPFASGLLQHRDWDVPLGYVILLCFSHTFSRVFQQHMHEVPEWYISVAFLVTLSKENYNLMEIKSQVSLPKQVAEWSSYQKGCLLQWESKVWYLNKNKDIEIITWSPHPIFFIHIWLMMMEVMCL